jgi:glycosyltransferase involved in cell wall biosynthesis
VKYTRYPSDIVARRAREEAPVAARIESLREEAPTRAIELVDELEEDLRTTLESSVDVIISYNDGTTGEETETQKPVGLKTQSYRHGRQSLDTDNTVFVIISFEGPDRYSLAGGLGVRVTNLSRALADSGYEVHHMFVGDPTELGEEVSKNRRLTLHRWCQWISAYYREGLYQGENEKLYDFNESVPWFVAECIAKPAVSQDKTVVILGEEWHTAEAMCRISDALYAMGIRDKVIMFWNANNTFSFHRINWGRLAFTTTITTVSRYMKQIMWGMGENPLVIPNGIPSSLLSNVDSGLVSRLRKDLDADLVLSKVARWDPDKRWNMAVESVARLKSRGMRALLIARGGIEPHGEEVAHNARSLGLHVADVTTKGESIADYMEAIIAHAAADVLNIRFHCPQDFLRIVYSASDAVLANSGHEPFGLVGLETMAARGIAVTGGTGEDYAVPFYNAIVLETANPAEIEGYIMYLHHHRNEAERIRNSGKETAGLFTWDKVIQNMLQKLEFQARVQGILTTPAAAPTEVIVEAEPEPTVRSRLAERRRHVPRLTPILAGSA